MDCMDTLGSTRQLLCHLSSCHCPALLLQPSMPLLSSSTLSHSCCLLWWLCWATSFVSLSPCERGFFFFSLPVWLTNPCESNWGYYPYTEELCCRINASALQALAPWKSEGEGLRMAHHKALWLCSATSGWGAWLKPYKLVKSLCCCWLSEPILQWWFNILLLHSKTMCSCLMDFTGSWTHVQISTELVP